MEVIIGIGRTVVIPGLDEEKPLDYRSYRKHLNSDMLKIDIPDGEHVSSLFMLAGGMEVVSIPLEPGGTSVFPRALGCWWCRHPGATDSEERERLWAVARPGKARRLVQAVRAVRARRRPHPLS